MQIERRALYNLIRMNWQLDPTIEVEAWQIEDYRKLPLEKLFSMLKKYEILLDSNSFIAFADSHDTPEDMTDDLLGEDESDVKTQDQLYLIIFELWRRLVPEKPCLSVFCDELDNQIQSYDQHNAASLEKLIDALANLQTILDENVDQGTDPHIVFETVLSGCAHDIETFLYDFILEQIEANDESYATELLDDFSKYIIEIKWFDFLRAQVLAKTDLEAANKLLKKITSTYGDENDLEFNLELLSFMARVADQEIFFKLIKQSLTLVEAEEDFQDLLDICADYYHYIDLDDKEKIIQKMINDRTNFKSQAPVNKKDPHLASLLKILESTPKPKPKAEEE